MGLYDSVDSGTKVYRSRFNLGHRKVFDCDFGDLVPAFAKFVLPGDVWRIGCNLFIRFQPMLSPSLTRCWARMRYFFVPLRLVNDKTEEIITGSKNGRLVEEQKHFNCFLKAETSDSYYGPTSNLVIPKWGFWDYLGIPVGDYHAFKDKNLDTCFPAAYWNSVYNRIYYDYYSDENFGYMIPSPTGTYFTYDNSSTFQEFNSYVQGFLGISQKLYKGNLKKDYFTSALHTPLKGVIPTFSVNSSIDFGDVFNYAHGTNGSPLIFYSSSSSPSGYSLGSTSGIEPFLTTFNQATINSQSLDLTTLRTLAAQTRIFERLNRCGSRYTEYLRSNFNVAPADGTLQRAQYLGSVKQPIVTTEVVQTTDATYGGRSYPTGTMRGHGISSGRAGIQTFHAKEFGVIMGILEIIPEVQYTQGINREFTYQNRFDFFNPSFQHLSEQEIRNSEVYVSLGDNMDFKEGDTFGFQAMYNELRESRDMVVGDMRDTLSYWTQAIHYNDRPALGMSFISAAKYGDNFRQPFAVIDGNSAKPIIVDCGNMADVYRPMVRYGTPGLVDHL